MKPARLLQDDAHPGQEGRRRQAAPVRPRARNASRNDDCRAAPLTRDHKMMAREMRTGKGKLLIGKCFSESGKYVFEFPGQALPTV